MGDVKEIHKTINISIIGNLFLAVVKGLAGIFGNSYALVADAIESTSDILSSLLLKWGINFAHKPADENHPYGHGRFEPLITFIVVGLLFLSAAVIIFQSIKNINTPHLVPKTFTLYILGAVIFIKELNFQYTLKQSKKLHSNSLKADAWHHRSDAITSIFAFIGISAAIIMGPGYEDLDDYAAILAAVVIIYNCYHIFRPALAEIMDEHLYQDLIEQIKTEGAAFTGVIEVEKCLVRKLGTKYQIDMHLVVNGKITVAEGHLIGHNFKEHLQLVHPKIADILIHIEPDQKI
jgi:cation diffusion facilitator family transporter